jgi:molecular chaperone IbpA
MRAAAAGTITPFNIERRDEDAYRITLAVAGFKSSEIDITAQQNLLVIQGRKAEEAQNAGQFLHLGIAQRGFERRFELADFVRVESAGLEDGLLVIDLVREVPEAMKPRKIAIGGTQPLSVIDGGAASEADAALIRARFGPKLRQPSRATLVVSSGCWAKQMPREGAAKSGSSAGFSKSSQNNSGVSPGKTHPHGLAPPRSTKSDPGR